ncbi:MAG: metallopeptidase TldD-related protein [Terriglobia bacterium]
MRRSIVCRVIVLLFIAAAVAPAQEQKTPRVLEAMKAELARSMQTLKGQSTPPYFLSYEITEDAVIAVTGSFGKLESSGENRHRQLDIDLRVGDYKLDNTHSIRGDFGGGFDRFSYIEVPMEDDPDALRSVLWYYTDKKYKRAVEQLTKVKTNVEVKVEQEDKSDDFSREAAEKQLDPIPAMGVDRGEWEAKIRKYTAPFARYGNIYEGQANFTADRETRWYTNSDGSEIQVSQVFYRLIIYAFTKSDDGMELPRYESYASFTPQGLPDDATVLKAVEKMIQDLQALRSAPIVDPYTGPAILSGRASAVFFHEVFGHRIEGHRQKEEEEGQTFKKKVGEKMLPDNFTVISDPTLRHLGKTELVGSYHFDNEGVRARPVTVVERGVFKNFLMSRSPIEGFPHSNGHGRRQQGYPPVARQSNLIVEVSKPLTHAALKQRLIEEVKKANKPFGLYFEDIQGGFTITQRTIPNAFNVLPIIVYRIYPDGREELVRGVDLIGTPLTAFSKIAAASDQVGVFNGICGAESGSVPVAAASPEILVEQIEVQKKEKSQERPPLLPPPFQEGGR